ncbi:MerR family transcriptional regulator [Streptomyces spectabilis]|uniref:DNA-binding transcriptional MerR regulator n=1 Tax=Streptomyces spectabilis TaxID=68270 RepID=A0A7W8APD6_STRST|nr:MerR family transcriptional regulator [Streptomyces spectabilis]MBB5102165.1 DNA-binding transcriptional MerR regulator [Streptomyces spectabilis]MCI3907213.1 MerR family transcriptional regulator [Streptomyces spectabilis]GGV29170.1 MerR family transcriptional regulator [Streptomyces spectabilis]
MPLLDGTLGIGDLARLTGVPVRTVRFYCDEGIVDSVRSTGGHRRFDPTAVERLRLVRRLRGLGLGLASIRNVLIGERSVAEVVAAERAALDVQLADMAWRRASLRAVEEAEPADRAARLELLAAVEGGGAARDALIDFWRRTMVAPASEAMLSAFVTMAVPEPPADPTPPQVVAFAELVALTGDRVLTRGLLAMARANAELIADEAELISGIREACALARPRVQACEAPRRGPELDRFVAVHASVRGTTDTPRFRRRLLADVAADHDRGMRRYWHLVAEASGDPLTLGASHLWLTDSLERCVRARDARPSERAGGGGPVSAKAPS